MPGSPPSARLSRRGVGGHDVEGPDMEWQTKAEEAIDTAGRLALAVTRMLAAEAVEAATGKKTIQRWTFPAETRATTETGGKR